LLVGALYKEKDIIAGGTSYIPLMGERDEEYFVVAFAGDTINDLYGFY
jgi:hypothetical protein